MDEYQRHLSSLVASSVQQLEYRLQESEAEEREVLRMLQVQRERRLADFRHAKDDLMELQLLVDAQLNQLREAFIQQQRNSSHHQHRQRQQQPQPPHLSHGEAALVRSSSRSSVTAEAAQSVGLSPLSLSDGTEAVADASAHSLPPPPSQPAVIAPTTASTSASISSSSSSSLSASSSSSQPSATSSRRKSPRKKSAAGKGHQHN